MFQIVGRFPTFTFHKVVYRRVKGVDGIFNDQFITQSLLRLRVKKWESVNNFAKIMGNKVPGRFFY